MGHIPFAMWSAASVVSYSCCNATWQCHWKALSDSFPLLASFLENKILGLCPWEYMIDSATLWWLLNLESDASPTHLLNHLLNHSNFHYLISLVFSFCSVEILLYRKILYSSYPIIDVKLLYSNETYSYLLLHYCFLPLNLKRVYFKIVRATLTHRICFNRNLILETHFVFFFA